MAQGDIDMLVGRSIHAASRAIEVVAGDPNSDAVFWSREGADAKAMMKAHYRNAVITGEVGFKLAFFDSYHRAKQIEQAISDYFAEYPQYK